MSDKSSRVGGQGWLSESAAAFIMPAILALGLVVVLLRIDPLWEPASQTAGVCRELISGSNEGRQALLGSCWVAPLPALVYLPFAWLLPEPLAGWVVFGLAWFFLLWAVNEGCRSTEVKWWRVVLAQLAISAVVLLSGGGVRQLVPVLAGGLVVLTASGLADWAAKRRLRDLVMTGSAAALLMLTGLPLFGVAGLLVVALPLAACGHQETRSRFWAWSLLVGLPILYAFWVWLLMNRLVLGDLFFFLRSLSHVTADPWRLAVGLLAPGLLLVAVLPMVWWLEGRQDGKPGAGKLAGMQVLLATALMVLASERLLGGCGIGWGLTALGLALPLLLVVAVTRLNQPGYQLVVMLALLSWVCRVGGNGSEAGQVRAAESREICGQVEEFVNGATPYGRVFVLGYSGIELLRGYSGKRLVPNLDLHIGSVREAYKGQNLYVLVPEPVGRVRTESVFWRYPDIYTHGYERLLFAGAFGGWHLFEIITAPTQEQIDEWRKSG